MVTGSSHDEMTEMRELMLKTIIANISDTID